MTTKDLVRTIWNETDAHDICEKYFIVDGAISRRYLDGDLTTDAYQKALMVSASLFSLAQVEEINLRKTTPII